MKLYTVRYPATKEDNRKTEERCVTVNLTSIIKKQEELFQDHPREEEAVKRRVLKRGIEFLRATSVAATA